MFTSKYRHNTAKVFTGWTVDRVVSHISQLYIGSISDVNITETEPTYNWYLAFWSH